MTWPRSALLVLFAACEPMNMNAGSAGRLLGANDLILVDRLDGLELAGEPAAALNRYLIVTSTDSNELRVLDLSGEKTCGAARCYLPGPNPLETLSIPVLDRPTSLAIDERYEDGVRKKGALLYATRPGGPEISIVGISPDEFREVRRVSLPAPVTALSALMVDRETSRLFVATFDGAASTIWELRFPSTPRALRRIATAELVGRLTPRLRIADESVAALLAVPGLAGRQVRGRAFCADAGSACLVMATRRSGGAGGRTLLLDPENLESIPLRFPGPVRALRTSDRVSAADEQLLELRDKTPPPGALIFGVLDEEACGSPRCGGVSTVDTRGAAGPDGFEVVRSEGFATQPVRWSDGLVRGLTIAAGGRVANVGSGGRLEVTQMPLLGSFTASNGELVFFDALEQRLLEQPGAVSALGPVRFRPAASSNGDGYLAGPRISGEAVRVGDELVATAEATIADGALRSQELVVSWRGELTPPGGLLAPRGNRLETAVALARKVEAGDQVVVAGCPSRGQVLAVRGTTIEVAGVDSCAPGRTTIRASGSRPFVIRGSFDGVLGRAGSGETFRLFGDPAVRLAGVDPTQPLLVIPFGNDTDTRPPADDTRWTLSVEGNLTPLVSVVDVTAFSAGFTQCTTTLTLPGAAVYDAVRQRLFVSYPSANLVVEFDPGRTVRGALGPNNGVSCYR